MKCIQYSEEMMQHKYVGTRRLEIRPCERCLRESGIHEPPCEEIKYANYFRGKRWRLRTGKWNRGTITVRDNMEWLFGS